MCKKRKRLVVFITPLPNIQRYLESFKREMFQAVIKSTRERRRKREHESRRGKNELPKKEEVA